MMYLFDIKIIPTLYGRLIVASMFLCFPHRNAKETPDRLLRPESLPDLVGSVDGESRTAFLAWQRRGFKTELKEPEGMTWPWEQTKHWCLRWCLVRCFVGEIGCFSGFTIRIHILYNHV